VELIDAVVPNCANRLPIWIPLPSTTRSACRTEGGCVAVEPGRGATGPSARVAGVPAEIGAALAVETAQAMANPSAQPRLSATANALRGFMIVSLSRTNEVGLSAY
jgi:hypothetical protein